MMEPIYTHKQQNIEKRKRKRGSLTFCGNLEIAPTRSHKQQNKNKKENRVLTFKFVVPNSPLLKLQAFHF
jgi:hypothetical protein